MGITEQGLAFLLSAGRNGVDFDRTMTIGRQFLLVPPDRLAEALAASDRAVGAPNGIDDDVVATFAEPLLRRLGAHEVRSIDGSDFEGATDVHDLNTPLPSVLFRRFSVVLDGGCLEHIFNFPEAMRSCMEMVEVGGHLLCMPPVNNAAGHGFYQLSPDLYFRVLSPENGFVVERMLLAEVRPGAIWYRLVDPATVGRRIEFTTRHEAYLYVQARRVEDRRPLLAPPVRSDYDQMWHQDRREPEADVPTDAGAPERESLAALRATFRRHPVLHVPVRRLRAGLAELHHRRHPYDPRYFEPLGRRLR